MAKVYSWDLGNNLFSYIIQPEHAKKINNNETGFTVNNAEPLVGTSELKGENLEAVKTWTANASIADYTTMYNKMVASAETYDISFGMVDNYIFANSVSDCDNLRGRGIKSIESIGSSIVQKDDGSYHTQTRCLVTYDDDTTSELSFDVKNGSDGRDGRDGNDGAKGDIGIATRTVFAFASGKDGNTPLQPQGGSWDGGDTVTYPDGWGPNDGIEPPVYMSNRTFATVESAQDEYWSIPTMISGEDGKPGADGVNIEFIYKPYKVALSVPPSTEDLDSENVDDFTPSGWSDSPSGVDEENRVEYVASRKRKDGVWGAWSPATIWSQYGVNGQDGDGVQYIYFLNNGNISEVVNPTPSDYETNEKYQEKDTEWLPSKGEYRNHNNDIVTIDDTHYWTDDPRGVSSTMQYEWVCQRKYRKSADSDKQAWQAFSEPTLWAKYGENGTNGTSIRTMYDVTPSTGDVPAFNKYDIKPGGSWQLGFPKNYEYGENVVWGINATIYSNTNEFVGEYKQVLDSNEEPIKPSDATTANTLTVYAIPNTKVENENIEYLIFDNVYYQWVKTGWEGPFLVTGTKGSDGTPMDYSVTAFCFASKDYPPQAPDTNVEPDNVGSSKDELGISREWYSLPDATIGVDGEIVNELVMRWYRCNGMVDSATQRVYKWSAVEVNSPMDGENIPGKYLEYRYAVMPNEEKPDTNFFENGKVIPEPELIIDGEKVGWFTTSNELPERKDGGVIWQIWTWKDGATYEILEGEIWHGPSRLTGDKGDMGPVGKRGVTGLPGAGYVTLYSLGNENEPFGTDEWENYNNKSYGPLKEYFKTWFEPCPDDTIIQVETIESAQEMCVVANIGRIVHVYSIKEETGTSTPTINSDDYYIISKSVELKPIDESKTELEEGRDEFVPYIWMIQGSEVWESGKSEMYVKLNSKPKDATDKNTLNEPETLPTTEQTDYKYVLYNGKYYSWQELEGTEVTHNKVGIAWEPPFRTQGISGLRGMSGSRGQVVYPMGVYNENEVYMTTESKAPYVYDSSDGLFYVYNETKFPWVGSLPPNPEKWEEEKKWQEFEEYKDVEELVPYYMTIKHITGYEEDGTPIEKYKYIDEIRGGWIVDQQGDRPCLNYANKTKNKQKPAWVRFESFEALYTNIGIIENGMIGSAVYNNEFMFSQLGLDRDGNLTNYAEESKGQLVTSGFLSSYEWVQNGKNVGDKGFCNWQYYGTTEWIADKDVNPYEVKNDNNKNYLTDTTLKNAPAGTPIHTFRPNVCINFKTGEMWTSAGKVNFDADGSGHLLDENILWYFGDQNTPVFQIGKDGEKGIRMSGDSITIGVLNKAIEDLSKDIQNLGNSTDEQIEELEKLLDEEVETLQNQVDKKAETYYQSNDPSTEWDEEDYDVHEGDMWYDTTNHNTYRWDGSSWKQQEIPDNVFDMIDGKASIFVAKPTNDHDGDGYLYHVNDMWLLEQDYTESTELNTSGKLGSIWVATASTKFDANKTNNGFKWGDWIKKGTELDNWVNKEYADELKDINNQIDKKSDCYYGPEDPSEKWQNTDSGIVATYAEYHLGDLWFNTNTNKSYTYSNSTASTVTDNVADYLSATPSGYYWRESNVPQGVFDRFDGKSSIFTSKPNDDSDKDGYLYHEGDMWLSGNDNAGEGEILRAIKTVPFDSSKTENGFEESDWIKASKYTDDTKALQALSRLNGIGEDGYVSPEEQKQLKTELASIEKEYNQMISACTNYQLTASGNTYHSAYEDYETWYNRAVSALTYYTSSTNYASNESDNKYYKCIKIDDDKTGTGTTASHYGNIAQYYDAKQNLQNALVSAAEDEAYESSKEYADKQYTAATAYTSSQISAITSVTTSIKTTLSALQGDVDGKAEMHSQPTDPSSDFGSTDDEIDKHLGDIWYNTTASTTQYLSKTPEGTYTSATATGYYWVRTDVPLELFDYSDGKSSLYTGVYPNIYKKYPNTGYTDNGYMVNDLWILPSNHKRGSGFKSGETLVCTAVTVSGKTKAGHAHATGFTASDWSRLMSYTDDSYAKEKFQSWAQDGYISPTEGESLKREKDAITKDYNGTIGSTYYNEYPSSAQTEFNTAYNNSLCAITYHTTFDTKDDVKVPIQIVTGTSKTHGYGWINKFHEEKQKARKFIDSQIQKNITDSTKDSKDEMAKQLGYSSYSDMVEEAKKGKIIQEGGYLNAGLIAASAITTEHLAASAITADKIDAGAITASMISGTVATIMEAEIGDLTVTTLNTKAKESDKTSGAIKISGSTLQSYNVGGENTLKIDGTSEVSFPSPKRHSYDIIDLTGVTTTSLLLVSGATIDNNGKSLPPILVTPPTRKRAKFTIFRSGSEEGSDKIAVTYNAEIKIVTAGTKAGLKNAIQGASPGNNSSTTTSENADCLMNNIPTIVPSGKYWAAVFVVSVQSTNSSVSVTADVFSGGGDIIVSDSTSKTEITGNGFYVQAGHNRYLGMATSNNKMKIAGRIGENGIEVTDESLCLIVEDTKFYARISGNKLEFYRQQ